MGQAKIDHLIINSPYEEPKYHWYYEREKRTFEKRQGRRPSGYITATPDLKSFDDPGIFGEMCSMVMTFYSSLFFSPANIKSRPFWARSIVSVSASSVFSV